MDSNDVKVTITVEYNGTTVSHTKVGNGAGNPLFAARVASETANEVWAKKIRPMLVASYGDIDDRQNVDARRAYGIDD